MYQDTQYYTVIVLVTGWQLFCPLNVKSCDFVTLSHSCTLTVRYGVLPEQQPVVGLCPSVTGFTERVLSLQWCFRCLGIEHSVYHQMVCHCISGWVPQAFYSSAGVKYDSSNYPGCMLSNPYNALQPELRMTELQGVCCTWIRSIMGNVL